MEPGTSGRQPGDWKGAEQETSDGRPRAGRRQSQGPQADGLGAGQSSSRTLERGQPDCWSYSGGWAGGRW